MPFLLKSTVEARTHLSEASRKVRQRIAALKGAAPKGASGEAILNLAQTVEDGMDDIHTQTHSTWEALDKVDAANRQTLAGVQEIRRMAETHTIEIKALEQATGTLESVAIEAKGDSGLAIKLAGSNLSQHQERQLQEAQMCIVLKGVPQVLTEGREKYRDMAAAFERAMVEIKLGREIHPKLLQRISKRKEDKSIRPPHMRVELQSVGQKVLIFEHIRLFKESESANPSFTVTPDIPKYALRRHNTLQKISQIVRESETTLHTRVCIRNKKWPELQMKDTKGEWVALPENIFEPARVEYNKRSREESERRKARRSAQTPMDTTTAGPSGSKNPRHPSNVTPAQTRKGKK